MTRRKRAPAPVDLHLALPSQAHHEEGAALTVPDDLIGRQHLGHAQMGDLEERQLTAWHPGPHPGPGVGRRVGHDRTTP